MRRAPKSEQVEALTYALWSMTSWAAIRARDPITALETWEEGLRDVQRIVGAKAAASFESFAARAESEAKRTLGEEALWLERIDRARHEMLAIFERRARRAA